MSTASRKCVSYLAREVVVETTRVKFNILAGSSVQDRALLSVAEELDLDLDKRTMHQGNNVGKSAT